MVEIDPLCFLDSQMSWATQVLHDIWCIVKWKWLMVDTVLLTLSSKYNSAVPCAFPGFANSDFCNTQRTRNAQQQHRFWLTHDGFLTENGPSDMQKKTGTQQDNHNAHCSTSVNFCMIGMHKRVQHSFCTWCNLNWEWFPGSTLSQVKRNGLKNVNHESFSVHIASKVMLHFRQTTDLPPISFLCQLLSQDLLNSIYLVATMCFNIAF